MTCEENLVSQEAILAQLEVVEQDGRDRALDAIPALIYPPAGVGLLLTGELVTDRQRRLGQVFLGALRAHYDAECE